MGTPPERMPARLIWQRVREQLRVLLTTVGMISLIALLLGMIAAGLLAGREELRTADLALVAAPEVPPAALVDHVFNLYRRGFVSQMVVVGEGGSTLRAELIARGLPEEVIAEVSSLRDLTRAGDAQSVLVVVAPAAQLSTIKQLHDQGLRAYHVPVRGVTASVIELLEASLRYWRYVLGG
jgi:hypothetical protein